MAANAKTFIFIKGIKITNVLQSYGGQKEKHVKCKKETQFKGYRADVQMKQRLLLFFKTVIENNFLKYKKHYFRPLKAFLIFFCFSCFFKRKENKRKPVSKKG